MYLTFIEIFCVLEFLKSIKKSNSRIDVNYNMTALILYVLHFKERETNNIILFSSQLYHSIFIQSKIVISMLKAQQVSFF